MPSYIGNFFLNQTVRFTFDTQNVNRALTTIVGGALAVYQDGSTTESTTGISLTVNFDGIAGKHQVVIDLSSDGTFYSSGHDFAVVFTAGTVNGVSLVGRTLFEFSIDNRIESASTTYQVNETRV